MGLFKRSAAATVDPGEVQRWRGRSAEIVDAGALPWQVVVESLKVAADAEPAGETDFRAWFMAALGLQFVEVNNRGTASSMNGNFTSNQTDIYYGERYGRHALINLGNQRSGQLGAMVVWISAATEPFSIVAEDGRLSPEGAVPLEVLAFLGGLSQQPALWRDVHLVAGVEGIVVKRPMRTKVHPQGWIYDLWLAEHIAHLASYTALPAPDPLSTYLPYGLDRAHAR